MSSHESNYQPTTRFGKWLDERLPVNRLVYDQLVAFPTPRNLNYLWTFGGILALCLVVQLITGIVLAMHYQPSGEEAFNSLDHIRRNVNYGWLIQPMHQRVSLDSSRAWSRSPRRLASEPRLLCEPPTSEWLGPRARSRIARARP